MFNKSMVRPKLENGEPIWYPNLKTHEREIEAIQRRATKMIANLGQTNCRPLIFIVTAHSKEYTNSDYTLNACYENHGSSTVMVIKIRIFDHGVTSASFW